MWRGSLQINSKVRRSLYSGHRSIPVVTLGRRKIGIRRIKGWRKGKREMLSNRKRLVFGGGLDNTPIVMGNGTHRLRKWRGPCVLPAPTKTIEVSLRRRPMRSQRRVHFEQAAPLRRRLSLQMFHASRANNNPEIEPFASHSRLNIKRNLSYAHSVKNLRGNIANVAHAVCVLPLRILHIARHLRNNPFPSIIEGFRMCVTLGVRENGVNSDVVRTNATEVSESSKINY